MVIFIALIFLLMLRDVLPPKKLLGNKDPAFLMRRRAELETYLQNIFHFLVRSLPVPLAEFLEFDKVGEVQFKWLLNPTKKVLSFSSIMI